MRRDRADGFGREGDWAAVDYQFDFVQRRGDRWLEYLVHVAVEFYCVGEKVLSVFAADFRKALHTVDLLDKLIHLASNPFMRPLRKQALRLVNEIKEVLPDDNEGEAT